MASKFNIRNGMEVYDEGEQLFGTVERFDDNQLYVNGKAMPMSVIGRVDGNRVYVGKGERQEQNIDGTLNVPVIEERLNVGKREVEAGEVQVRKTVEQEQVSIPVELRREEVQVEQRDTPDRPLKAGELENAFQGGTIRVRLRAEEAVVSKEAFVSGEVAINKQQVVEKQQVTDTVRKERVEVDENVQKTGTRTDVQRQDYATAATQTPATNMQTQSYDTTATTGRTASTSSSSSSYGSQLQEGMEVLSSDGENIGKIEEVGDTSFVVDRKGLFSGDLEVDYQGGVQSVNGNQVMLTMTKDQLDNMA